MNREDLKKHFDEHQELIESRLEEFESLRDASEERLFKELVFVLLTSQSSAENSWKACNELEDKKLLLNPDKNRVEAVLEKNQIQFEKRKSDYIVSNFNFLRQPTFSNPSQSIKISSRIKTGELKKTRKWIVENIKGLSWKGASHFLRNIGYGDDFAILSQHTVSVLFDLDVLKIAEPPKNEEEYLEAEKAVRQFSEEIGIEIKALDLALWSYKTGEVFK